MVVSIVLMANCYVKAEAFDEDEIANPFRENDANVAFNENPTEGNEAPDPFNENQEVALSASQILSALRAFQNENENTNEKEAMINTALAYLRQQGVLVAQKVIIPKDTSTAILLEYMLSQKLLTDFEKNIHIDEPHEVEFLVKLMYKGSNPFENVDLNIDIRELWKNYQTVGNFLDLLAHDQSIKSLKWISDFGACLATHMEYFAKPLKTNETLKELYLGFGGGTDITPIGQALTSNHSLEKLSIEGTLSSKLLNVAPLFFKETITGYYYDNNFNSLVLKGHLSIDCERSRLGNIHLPKNFSLYNISPEIMTVFFKSVGNSEDIETLDFSYRRGIRFDDIDAERLAEAIWRNEENNKNLKNVRFEGETDISEDGLEILKRAKMRSKKVNLFIGNYNFNL